jgi:hypothetical protein
MKTMRTSIGQSTCWQACLNASDTALAPNGLSSASILSLPSRTAARWSRADISSSQWRPHLGRHVVECERLVQLVFGDQLQVVHAEVRDASLVRRLLDAVLELGLQPALELRLDHLAVLDGDLARVEVAVAHLEVGGLVGQRLQGRGHAVEGGAHRFQHPIAEKVLALLEQRWAGLCHGADYN